MFARIRLNLLMPSGWVGDPSASAANKNVVIDCRAAGGKTRDGNILRESGTCARGTFIIPLHTILCDRFCTMQACDDGKRATCVPTWSR